MLDLELTSEPTRDTSGKKVLINTLRKDGFTFCEWVGNRNALAEHIREAIQEHIASGGSVTDPESLIARIVPE